MPITPMIIFGVTGFVEQSETLHHGVTAIYPTYTPPTYEQPDGIGILEAISEAIGESDNEIGGFRATRLSTVINEGATTFNVESALDWPASGIIAVDGIKYYYASRTNTTLVGVTFIKGGASTNGAATQHRINSAVVEISREWSAVELLRRAIFVNYAEGEDLDVVGRNIGVNRLPMYGTDTKFRTMIKVLGYNPKGTIYGIQQALDGLLGAGNYVLYEDIQQYPNTVFVEVSTADLLTEGNQGKAFLTGTAYGIVGDGALNPNEVALPANTLRVGSVRAAKLDELFSFRTQKPSALTYAYYPGHGGDTAFTYQGTQSEATGVVVDAAEFCKFKVTAPAATAHYRMSTGQGARISPEGYAEASCLLLVPTGSTLTSTGYDQISLGICDGAKEVQAGISSGPLEIGLYYDATTRLGSTKTINLDQWYEVTIKKYGEDRAELWVDGSLISTVAYSALPPNFVRFFEFGLRGSTSANCETHIRQIGLGAIDSVEHWSLQETGSVNSANPNRLTGGATDFETGDVGKRVTIRESGIDNGSGGNNNGVWVVDSFIDVDNIDLVGETYSDAVVSTITPNRITLEERTLTYPDDLGKTIVIEGSGPNAGSYTIAELRDPDNPTADLADYLSPITIKTNVCEVSAGGFTNESGLGVHLEPTFATEGSLAFELSDAGSTSGVSPNQIAILRGDNTLNGQVVEIMVTDVLSAQVLPISVILNTVIQDDPLLFEYYPFYLANPLGNISSFMDMITAAGVIPEFDVG